MTIFRQALATTVLGLKSLPRRTGSSASAVISIALVVLVLLGFASMGNGFRQVLDGSGSDDVAMVLREGASSAQGSVLGPDQLAALDGAPGIVRMNDRPEVSPELAVVVALNGAGKEVANVTIRGISPESGFMTRGANIVEGRAPRPGSTEIVVGKSAAAEFSDLRLGRSIRLAATEWKIVGVFAAGGGIYETEARADLHVVQSVFRRGTLVQSARALLDDANGLQRLNAYLAANQQLQLTATRESDYFRSLSKTSGTFIERLGWPLALLMAIGALAGACNAMYTSIDGRRREIVTMRTLGYGRTAIFVGVIAESLCLAALGAVVGTVVGWAVFDGMRTSTAATSLGQVAFAFEVSMPQIMQAFTLSVAVGLLGGIAPALKAMRLPLVLAGRE